MSSDDVVVINDDNHKDSDIEIVDTSKVQKSTQDNAIIVDDDIIEIIDVDINKNNEDIKDYLTKVCSENRLIGEFIEKCFELENSDGMLRVIYRTFLPLYFKMEDGYRESRDFEKAIDMTMRALEVNPCLKFTHMRSLCEILKSKSRDRKKVQFTTLSTNVTAKQTKPKPRKRRKRCSKFTSVKKSKKRKLDTVIEIDESSDGENKCDESTTSHIPKTNDVVVLEDDYEISNTSNKENRILEQSSAVVRDSNMDIDANRVNNNNTERNLGSDTPQQVMPQGMCLVEMDIESQKKDRIQQIEKQIQFYKNAIDSLEQQEVNTDSMDSPYIRCERLKSHIVLLYQEMCSLTGDEPVKKREVHFTATDGRPQLPLKMLEKFINENIGSDGNPNLPDFVDVVNCVCQANEIAGLGWDKTRIWREARALFTFCGQALQDSRKKRDWRYLRGLAKSQLHDDPAEQDPELLARLEANRRIAVKKELDLLDQYVKMEEGRYDGESIPTDVHIHQDCSDDETEENTFAVPTSITNIGSQVISATANYNANNFRNEDLSWSSGNNVGYICAGVIYDTSDKRFVINQVPEMTIKQSHTYNNSMKGKTDTRMLEVSIGDNQNTEFRLVPVNNTNHNENQNSVVSAQENNEVTKMIEVCLENNKPPEVKVINVASNDPINNGNVEQDTIIDTSTCLIEFDNSIREKHVETFEDTYKDFVKIREHCSCFDACNSICKKNKSSKKMPLRKKVYSVVTKDIHNTHNKHGNNYMNLGNDSPISEPSKKNYPCTQATIFNDNGSNTPVASENMPMIKEVYSVITKQYNTNIPVNNKPSEICPCEAKQENVTVESQNMVNEDGLVVPTDNDVATANTNSEEPKSNVEEENPIKVKTEVSVLLKEMESFGDSVTATVFDIEDPFLIIEISDSSDESDGDLES